MVFHWKDTLYNEPDEQRLRKYHDLPTYDVTVCNFRLHSCGQLIWQAEEKSDFESVKEYESLPGETEVMEEPSVQDLVRMVTAQGSDEPESEDDTDDEVEFEAPIITSVEAQTFLREVARYCSGIEELQPLVNTLSNAAQLILHDQMNRAKQTCITDVFHR